MDPVLLVAEDGEAIVERPRREVRVLFEHELLDASYARSEGGERGASPHIHVEHVDAFYIVEGELSFVVGRDLDVVRASAGTFVMVPPNLIHGFDNDSDARARWLTSTRRAPASSGGCAVTARASTCFLRRRAAAAAPTTP